MQYLFMKIYQNPLKTLEKSSQTISSDIFVDFLIIYRVKENPVKSISSIDQYFWV